MAGRGRPTLADAGEPSFNSVEAVIRLLTPDNRRLLATIRDRKPQLVAQLGVLTGRAAELHTHGGLHHHEHRPAAGKKIVVDIDPYSDRDRLRVA